MLPLNPDNPFTQSVAGMDTEKSDLEEPKGGGTHF